VLTGASVDTVTPLRPQIQIDWTGPFRYKCPMHDFWPRACGTAARIASCFVLCWTVGWVSEGYSDEHGTQLIDRYLNQSARKDAVLKMEVQYEEPPKEAVRLEFTWMRKIKDGLASHLLRMESPPSEKGKLLLVRERPDGGTDYVAYRPNSALKKKVRVNAARNYKYKGLSISVQELIGGELHKYNHQYRGAQTVDSISCQLVESTLRDQFKNDSNYPRTLIYLRDDNGMPLKWELFGNSNRLEKRIQVEEIKQLNGVWTLNQVRVDDLKKKSQLRLILKEVDYHPDLKDQMFSELYLKQNSN